MIGFTQLYPSFSSISMRRIWILNDLFVAEDRRGRGAAQRLLDAAKAYAVETNAKGLALSTAVETLRLRDCTSVTGTSGRRSFTIIFFRCSYGSFMLKEGKR